MAAAEHIGTGANVTPISDDIVRQTPPHNLEAEQALLGAILVNNEALTHVRDTLLPEHFYEPVHGRVYEAICKLADKNEMADPVKLKPFFEHDEALKDVGGARYLVRLAASAATVINARDYAATVLDLARRRSLIMIADRLSADAYGAGADMGADDIVAEHEAALNSFLDAGTMREVDTLRSSATVADSALKMIDAARNHGISGIRTGLDGLDAILGGLKPSELTVLAGRPAMGKSALASFISDRVSKSGSVACTPVGLLFASGEMDAESNIKRALSEAIYDYERQEVPYSDMDKGALSDTDMDLVVKHAETVARQNIYWMDEPSITPARLRARARAVERRFKQDGMPLGLIVVDYLQIMQADHKTNNRTEEITSISNGLRALAKELKIPVLALSQLSRAVDQRENKRPLLSDLRESGQIEQDAATIMFAYRPEYYLQREEPELDSDKRIEWEAKMEAAKGTMEVIIAKNRGGPVGTVNLTANMTTNHFSDE